MNTKPQDLSSAQNGLVISYFGNSVAVEAEDGQVFLCYLRRNQELPVVGDKVVWQLANQHTGIILQIKPRQTLLVRGAARGSRASKPIAANIDMIAIVMAPPPVFSEYLIDRYLVAAELLQIQAMLVLNKMDLLDQASQGPLLDSLAPYRNLSYPVVLSSIYSKETLLTLGQVLKEKSAVLVGPSGVGKSSIIAALGDVGPIRIGELTPKGAGKHATTATRLYHLPGGTSLVDSPGVREFNLWPVHKEEVLRGFKEFAAVGQGCKFRDCIHLAEPGCAVQAAVTSGKISAKRYANYQTLIKEAMLRPSW